MRELARSDTNMIFCTLSLQAQEAFGGVVPEANTAIFNSLSQGNQVNAVDAFEDVVWSHPINIQQPGALDPRHWSDRPFLNSQTSIYCVLM